MKTNVLTNSTNTGVKESFFLSLKKALFAGAFGYFLFLVILMATKTLSYYLIRNTAMVIETTDFVLPVIGFILIALIKFLENYKSDEL